MLLLQQSIVKTGVESPLTLPQARSLKVQQQLYETRCKSSFTETYSVYCRF